MAARTSLAVAIVVALAVAGCGKSPSAYHVGYPGYTVGSGKPPPVGHVSPPSSGTSNGTGQAVPSSAMTPPGEPSSGSSTPPGMASPAADATPAAWTGAAPAGPAATPQLSEQDRQFLYWATQRALALAALDQLATKNAQSAAVKAFAQNSLQEQERRRKALDALAQTAGASPPHDIDKKYRDLHDNMAAVRDTDFDHLFMRTVVGEERDQIDLYDQEGKTGRSPGIAAFVAHSLPQLHQHYAEARRVDLQLPGTAPLMAPSGTIETHRPSPEPMSR